MELFVSESGIYYSVKMVYKGPSSEVYVCQKPAEPEYFTLTLIKDNTAAAFMTKHMNSINVQQCFTIQEGLCIVTDNRAGSFAWKDNCVEVALGITQLTLTSAMPPQLLHQLLEPHCIASHEGGMHFNHYFSFCMGWADVSERDVLLKVKSLIQSLLPQMPNHGHYSLRRFRAIIKKDHAHLMDFYIQLKHFVQHYQPPIVWLRDKAAALSEKYMDTVKKIIAVAVAVAAVIAVYVSVFFQPAKDSLAEKIGVFLLDKRGEIIEQVEK